MRAEAFFAESWSGAGETAPGQLLARGESRILGIPLVRMQVRFERI